MKVLSVNVGLPRDVSVERTTVRTAIFKTPVSGRVGVTRLNIDGDRQADLAVHGGVDKAVYVYPSEHYRFWSGELVGTDLPWGAFGENLTTEGLVEETVHIGDRLRVGSCEFQVAQPRMPCYKLGIRFQRADIVKRFLRSRLTGFYLRVCREGDLAAADEITVAARDPNVISVAAIVGLYVAERPDPELLRRASELPALSGFWREHFGQQLSQV